LNSTLIALGIAAAELTLGIAAIGKKSWQWWTVGIVVLLVALFSHFNQENSTYPEVDEAN
jgi:hypothetical protein